MLRMLPVREPEGLVMPVSQYPGEPDNAGFSWTVFERLRDQSRVFSDLFGVSPVRFQVTGEGLEEEPVEGAYAVGATFPTLGVQPAIGRLFGPGDDVAGDADAAVAVVSWEYWKRRFNLDPAILGRRLVAERYAGDGDRRSPARILRPPGRREDRRLGSGRNGHYAPATQPQVE